MKLAILFWCYRNPEICENRIKRLRKDNHDTMIYILFGGKKEEKEVYKKILSPFADDFYHFAPDVSNEWKWLNGDLMISEWFRERGRFLKWDTITVVQWDMLIFGSVRRLFSELRKDQILLSGLRELNYVASYWYWAGKNAPENYRKMVDFKDFIRKRYNFDEPLLACHFISVCLPRNFLEPYSRIDSPERGMIEYRVPTYARLFGTRFCNSKKYDSWWYCSPDSKKVRWLDRRLIPTGCLYSQPLIRIILNLIKKNGGRAFHPFNYIFPERISSLPAFLINRNRLEEIDYILKKLDRLNLKKAIKKVPEFLK